MLPEEWPGITWFKTEEGVPVMTIVEAKRQADIAYQCGYQFGREDERREYDEIMQACKTFGDLCRAIEARGKE